MREYSVLIVFASRRLHRFLVARHIERGWELPGGHVEEGEDPLSGARREWDEETGLPLGVIEEVALHRRPDGSRGHLFLGAVRDEIAPGAGPEPEVETAGAVDPRGRIVEQRWVARLEEVAPLAFPGDPYEDLARAVGKRAREDPDSWALPEGEDPEGFVKRVSRHPEAEPRGDPVELRDSA